MTSKLTFDWKLFGGKMYIEIYSSDELIETSILNDIMAGAQTESLRLQSIFNLYDVNSELSRLNRERKLEVSKEMREVLVLALKLCELTDGMYDITLGQNILQRKSGKELKKVACSYKDVLIKRNVVTLNNPEVIIDLGSIAKGYITDKIAEYLREYGVENGMIDSRGDIRFFGSQENIIEIQHPRIKSDALCKIQLKDKSVATSGDYNQFDKTYEKNHIINSKDLISITVVADALTLADGLATALFVCDKKIRKDLLTEFNNVKVLSVDKSLRVEMFNGFEKLLIK